MPKTSLFSLFVLSPLVVFGANVATDLQLQDAIINANDGVDTTINFLNDITLGGGLGTNLNLRPLNAMITFEPANQPIIINGNGHTLDGGGSFRGFFVNESPTAVTITNLRFNNTAGLGGDGGTSGGGGGGGLGGAVFVNTGASVTFTNPIFSNSSAIGGQGRAVIMDNSAGGGGGFTGAGGNGGPLLAGAGGGGGGGINASGGVGPSVGGGGGAGLPPMLDGTGGNNFGDTAGSGGSPGTLGPATNGQAGIDGGGGGGGLFFASPGTGGGSGSRGGGGGGAAATDGVTATGAGAAGGDFGGGGGSSSASPVSVPRTGGAGGTGGFGGGGGGAGIDSVGGTGGFAGGGGSGSIGGGNGFGGGIGTQGGGGGGAGFGGALFLQGNPLGSIGAQVVITGSCAFSSNSVTAGSSESSSAQAGQAKGPDIFMMSSSQITFDLSSDLVMPSAIAGDSGAGGGSQIVGGLIKSGPARLELVGSNEYTGATTVSAGELAVNGAVSTELIVEQGGTLTGSMSVRQVGTNPSAGNLTCQGILAPGNNGSGSINVEGSLVLEPTAVFMADIRSNGTSNRVTLVNSNVADLGNSTLNIFVNSGNYIEGTTYEIIDGPVGGSRFGSIIQSGPLANQLEIEVLYSSVVLRILTTILFENQDILPGVPTIVANCFRNATIVPGSDFAMIAEILGQLSNSQVNAALDTLAPTPFGALEWINARNNSYVADLLAQHLFALCCSPRDCSSCDCNGSAWINIFGNIMDNTKTLDNLRPFDANAVGVLGGIDFCCGDECCWADSFYWGASIGYNRTHLIWRNQGGKGNLNSYYGALYGSVQWSCFTIDGSVLGGASEQDLDRRIVFGTIDRTARSDPWGFFATGHLGLRQQLVWCWGTSEFFALADYHYYHREGFTEKGANSLNLNVLSHGQHFIRGESGIRAYEEYAINCGCFSPYIGLSFVGEFPINDSEQRATFEGRSCPLDVVSYKSSACLASPQIGGKWTCNGGASLILGYKGLFNRSTRINQVEGRFEWVF